MRQRANCSVHATVLRKKLLHCALPQTLKNVRLMIIEKDAAVAARVLPAICVHEEHFVRILQNLLSHAIKYRDAQTRGEFLSPARSVRKSGSWPSATMAGILSSYIIWLFFSVCKRLHAQAYADRR